MSCKRRMDGLVARLENVQAGANLSRTLVGKSVGAVRLVTGTD